MCRKKGIIGFVFKRLKKNYQGGLKVENIKLSADLKLARYYQEVMKKGICRVDLSEIDYLELEHILAKAITYYKLDVRTDLNISDDIFFQKNNKTIKSDDRLERLGVEDVK